jgi:hypothetical protein
MRKYVVVSNLPDDFLDDQISSEYGTYDEAVDALLECVGHASDISPLMEEYYVGSHVYSIYRQK